MWGLAGAEGGGRLSEVGDSAAATAAAAAAAEVDAPWHTLTKKWMRCRSRAMTGLRCDPMRSTCLATPSSHCSTKSCTITSKPLALMNFLIHICVRRRSVRWSRGLRRRETSRDRRCSEAEKHVSVWERRKPVLKYHTLRKGTL